MPLVHMSNQFLGTSALETYAADKWCAETLAEWESVTEELFDVRFSDKDTSSLLHKALVKRTEEKKADVDKKASAATLVQQLMSDTEHGSVTIEVPGLLDVKLTW